MKTPSAKRKMVWVQTSYRHHRSSLHMRSCLFGVHHLTTQAGKRLPRCFFQIWMVPQHFILDIYIASSLISRHVALLLANQTYGGALTSWVVSWCDHRLLHGQSPASSFNTSSFVFRDSQFMGARKFYWKLRHLERALLKNMHVDKRLASTAFIVDI